MIHLIPHPVSTQLQKENEAHQGNDPARIASAYPSAEDFLAGFLQRLEGAQFRHAARGLAVPSRVLDIGAGQGQTSIYLASRGHQVAVVEPSPHCCRYLERAAELYRLPVTIYQVTAEYMHRLPVRGFDACVFNASFHHCDDPARALANCYAQLVPGGRLFLLNEPQLQIFRSRAWYYRQLEERPEEMGHYGGNEHIYYHHEYLALLRQAGFQEIRDVLSLRYQHPERYLSLLAGRGVAPGPIRTRQVFYRIIQRLHHAGPLGRVPLRLLKSLSLLQTHFTAVKRAA